MRLRFLALPLLLAAPACVPPPPPPSAAAPAPAAPPAAPAPVQAVRPSGDWIDWPLAAGDWTYRRDARGSIALFGPPGAEATITLRCDAGQRRIYLGRQGTGSPGRMTIRTNSASKELATIPAAGTPAYLVADIQPADAILDAMALSRGRFALEVQGQLPVAIPSWAEITRITEDCREQGSDAEPQ